MSRAEDLIDSILNNPTSPDAGVTVNQLLTEFHRGYPVEKLRQLLASQNDDVVRMGAWIASELGPKGRPLLSDAVALLNHPRKNVRFFVVDCILAWTGPSNGKEVAAVIPLLEDTENAVRWKAMDFLSLASEKQLRAALSYLELTAVHSAHVAPLRWLLETSGADSQGLPSIMQGQDALFRRYAVVAAARMQRHSEELLSLVLADEDPAVRQFAADMIKLRELKSGSGN